jgi:alkanesulfonate monooxygenase SsuD/methylene tetrahydromethanopterin reductase-like flavin-dependent oxidoreductase (luciferase family)
VNYNIDVTTNMFCLDDGDEARLLVARARTEHYSELFLQWLDSFPRPPHLPKTGPVKLPAPTPGELKERLARGAAQYGSPEEIAAVIRRYEAIGVDQLIYSPLTMTMDQKQVLRSIDTFGRRVLPLFDKDPMHRTTRQRQAALDAAAA